MVVKKTTKAPKLAKNQAKKNPVGRPREHDREAIGKELLEWAKLPNSINLNKFCCTRDPPLWPCQLSIWSDEDSQFRKSYETAKAFLGARREEWLTAETLHVKAYDLNAANYDYFLKKERRDQQIFEAKLNAEEHAALTKEDLQRMEAMMKAMAASQAFAQSSARNIANINIMSEDKS